MGHCTDIVPKTSYCGFILDIGICAEYENGEKFWCHASSEDLEGMMQRYKESEAYNG